MRSLLSAAEEAALETPQEAWVYLPNQQADGEYAWTPTTWSQLKTAVDDMACWAQSQLGLPDHDNTVAYIGSNDVRYPIVMLACMKVGYKVLFASPRNSTAGHSSLFASVQCQKLLYSPELRNPVDEFVASHEPKITAIQVPSVSDLLSGATMGEGKRIVNSADLREEDTVIILHSSGTTGLPKPIHLNAGALAVMDTIKEMEAPPGRCNVHDELYTPTIMISMLPFFHIMGIATLLRAIYHRGPLAFLPTGKPTTVDLMIDAINQVGPSAIACAPSILEAMSSMVRGMEALSKVDNVFYGGAPLAQPSGDKISRVTTLLNGIGSTEVLNVPSYIPRNFKDWEYFEWNPEYGAVMEDREDGNFELVVKQKYSRKHQLLFHNFPQVSEWKTSDLFEKHPTKKGLWRYIGRSDDTMVLSNGEKVTPVLFEKAIEGHDMVKGALLVGSQRFQTCLIIEPHDTESTPDDGLLDDLWPSIDAANAILPSHAKVWPSMVILGHPDKPFVRAPKGSVKREATCQLYGDEIDRVYTTGTRTALSDGEIAAPNTPYTAENAKTEIRKAVYATLQTTLSDDEDFFHNGMDSLRALQLHRTLQQGLASRDIQVPLMAIYKSPTIDRLANYILSTISGSSPTAKTTSREERMSAMIHKHSKSLPRLSAGIGAMRTLKPKASHVTVLTGSTGSLGTYILYSLLSQPQVSKIYCLNRSNDALARQKRAFEDRHLDASTLGKAVFLTVDLMKPHFDLPPPQYEELKAETTYLVHNAWPVNFNNDLDYFTDSIYGIRCLIDFVIAAPHKPHFVFVSSIASVGNFSAVRPEESMISEEMDEDSSLPLAQGYGESKHVGSCIVSRAARLSGLRGAIVRVGQLSGPDNGDRAAAKWNKTEWLPAMVSTSKNLGKIPSSLGIHDSLDWVPVNKAAEILLELTMPSLCSPSSEIGGDPALACYNLTNPQTGDWRDMAITIQQHYNTKNRVIERVYFGSWIKELEGIKVSDTTVSDYPAIKLLEFYKEMSLLSSGMKSNFATHLGEARSAKLAGLRPVDGRLMESWLQGWDSEE